MSTFNFPVALLQNDYTLSDTSYCSIGIQTLDKMDRVFNITEERHFYFGDIFFKQFVGIFDMANGLVGMAKSSRASSTSVTFECLGDFCTEPNEAE